ncbi:MAG: 1-deoxy-D-xylulose-5-phosphate synthase [candidate division WS6 bacterium OLB20]|uniref:1-deoxy-D-xylulose-5-phosphate synthase n=1 Tax=candidate division WS6 bacterium OLB20 TaxID=1617426 RepID=A0A136LW90_9BACT|nr:MAG: 1-deoxy-D-xylulose-5-phosphate synthase [candidate division WS6 bacterium OLB20]
MQTVNLRNLSELELKPIRDGFGEGFLNIGAAIPDVIGLNADLTESVRMHLFEEKYPERFFQVGICEQNMAGVAAGMALSGKIPYMGSFANFSPGRNYDQIRTSICMMNANVKIVSSHAGFSHGSDGITVQMLEDIAMMRSLPNMTVLVPADAYQAMQMAEAAATIEGPVYLRLGRSETPLLFAEGTPFVPGEAQLLRDGSHVTIFAAGYLVFRALLAADNLHKQGIEAQVINIHTIKPLDEASVLAAAAKTGAVVTAEEAQVNGGLGGAIAEVLGRKLPTPMEMVAVMDQFGETGTTMDLNKSRNLMEDDIVAAVLHVLERKSA